MDPPKRVPLLPVTSTKVKEEAKTYAFELKLGESNDDVYPEYSWKDLVRDAERKKKEKSAALSGHVTLDPYASDDEDALKAMAAKFEEKYKNSSAGPSSSAGKVRKRKRQAEDYIDKGAGYDENDSFIDNTDIYDEIVPEDCQTARGGFYINSGALEYKEAEVSEGEEPVNPDSQSQKSLVMKKKLSKPPVLKPQIKITPPVGANKRPNDGSGPPKKRRDSTSSVVKKIRRKSTTGDAPNLKKIQPKTSASILKVTPKADGGKEKDKNVSMVILSSSSSSSSSSSEGDSSSSGSESESSEEDDATKKNKLIKATIFRKSAAIVSANANNNGKPMPVNPARRLKVKNVPLNPKLHGGITTPSTTLPNSVPASTTMSNRDIFSMSNSKGMNSLPPGLTVTPNVSPPKLSPLAVGNLGMGIVDLKPKPSTSTGISVSPIISKARPGAVATAIKKQRPPKLTSMLNSTSPPKKAQKPPKISPSHAQLAASILSGQPKYGSNSSILNSYQNFQLQSANLAALVGLRPPFPELKKNRNTNNVNKNKNNGNNNNNTNRMSQSFSGPNSNSMSVTEVKEKNRQSSSPAFNNKSLNLSGGSGHSSPVSMARLSSAITITNSPALNLSAGSSSVLQSSKSSPLHLTPPNLNRKNFKVTPHDVNSLLNYPANVNSILASNQSTQQAFEKILAHANGGVPMSRDSQSQQKNK